MKVRSLALHPETDTARSTSNREPDWPKLGRAGVSLKIWHRSRINFNPASPSARVPDATDFDRVAAGDFGSSKFFIFSLYQEQFGGAH